MHENHSDYSAITVPVSLFGLKVMPIKELNAFDSPNELDALLEDARWMLRANFQRFSTRIGKATNVQIGLRNGFHNKALMCCW